MVVPAIDKDAAKAHKGVGVGLRGGPLLPVLRRVVGDQRGWDNGVRYLLDRAQVQPGKTVSADPGEGIG